ncbi:aldo/keto reductase [Adlercreutzia sp. R21]|uniref:aldo/keto reductase n=1 Tax=Adlercreutzia wanghongyangiae TaxID=3111451 RepID=UPI002DB58818|nr:aldo/keto reductase [Adlercreutzia sp. R21]MEC4184825.1 aldo/keto reductase [Adlercreutzia sp. R21]
MSKQERGPLGFGTMRLPVTENGAVDIEAFESMADMFIERGYTYFDTSYVYMGGKSEEAVRRAVVERHPRDSFTIATKLPQFSVTSEQDFGRFFNEQLANCGVDCFDYYLIHAVTNQTYDNSIEKFHLFEQALEEKRAGRIKRLGFSFHDSPQFLDQVLTEHPEVDFVQIIINYFDWDSLFIASKACYEVIRKHGKDVVVMEPVKGGLLANLPEDAERRLREVHPDWSDASWALRFAMSFEGVIAVLPGMSTLEQVDDNTASLEDFTPLTADEKDLLFSIARELRESGPAKTSDFSAFDAEGPSGMPVAAIVDAYNAMMIQGGAGAELNYYFEWRYRNGIFGKGSIIDGMTFTATDGSDITSLVQDADKMQRENALGAV